MHAVGGGEEPVLGHDPARTAIRFCIDDLIGTDRDDLIPLVERNATNRSRLALLLQRGDEPEQAFLSLLGFLAIQLGMDPFEDHVQPFLSHRLEDVVDGMQFKRFHRIGIIGSDKDDEWVIPIRKKHLCGFDSGQSRHLDIQKDNVRM
ncbi:hypothetical protein SDC9_97098 [bioreactor metagenome]|uniref:Uncharacterized protein n=1 Tax=bioreactor metagenome TaxID=1076179 RepID=A0A645AAW1_9ZZZZ